MPTISVTLPNDGDEAVVDQYNAAILAILGVINGEIDSSNIAAGSIPWSAMSATISNAIPVAAMVDNGNLVKSRKDTMVNGVVNGTGVWTADAPGSTLNGSMTALTVYINGQRIVVSAVTAHAFTASKDTYIDVLDNGNGTGTVGYTAVANGASSGFTLAANSVRIAKVVSGSSNILNAASISQFGVDALGTQLYPVGQNSSLVTQAPVSFKVYRNNSFTIGNTTSVIAFDNKIYDRGNNVSISTGLFTAPVNGLYHFAARSGSAVTSGNEILITLSKKGSATESSDGNRGISTNTQSGLFGAMCATEFELVAGDTVEVDIYSNSNVAGQAGQTTTWFSGYLIGTT